MAISASAWAENGPVRLEIPAQDLDGALQTFARQSGAQIIYNAAIIKGRTSPGVRGELKLEEGLVRLLRGTGLQAVPSGENGFALVEGDAAAPGRAPTTLGEVVVTATKTPVAVNDLPVSVTVVDKAEIEQMPATDLTDVLRRVPGVDIARNSATGVATVSMRGMGFQRSVVLIDGQPAEFLPTGVGGRTAVQAIDPLNVERIEVVRGAGSALYGSNAMGGVINIITKKGVAGQPEGEVHAGLTSRDTKSAGASARGGVGKVTYSLTANVEDAAGYKPLRDPTPDAMEDFNLTNVAWRNRRVGGNLGAELAEGHEVNFGINNLFNDSNPSGRPHTDGEITDTVLSLGSSHQLTNQLNLSTAFGWRTHAGDYNFDSYQYWSNPDTSKTSALEERADKYTAEVKAIWNATDSHRLLAGTQYTLDTISLIYDNAITGLQSDDRGGDVRNLGVYLQDEIAVTDALGVTLGMRYDSFDYDLSYRNYDTMPVTARTVQRSWQTINPRAAARYQVNDAVAVRSSVGTAFRAPDTFGLMGRQQVVGVMDYQPNPDLKAERSINYDVGTDLTPWPGSSLGVTGFYSSIRDAIGIRMYGGSPLIIRQENIGRVVSKGLEFDGRQQLVEHLTLGLAYTYTDARVESEAPVGAMGWPAQGRHTSLTPLHKVVASLLYDQPEFLAVRLDGRYVSEQYGNGDSDNTYANRLAPYFTSDLSAIYTLPVDTTQLRVTAAVTNLTDRRYATYAPYYMEEGRTFHLQLGWKF
ncbi:MAG TPA: TonB-dependent receptor [Magnetospirillum sp.]|nr:TonB-dependent receptor [Magnetospirillum sp.]